MPVRPLPPNPILAPLEQQAEDLLQQHSQDLAAVAQKLREFHPTFARSTDPEIFAATLTLADAQLTIAREHGFPTWARLKRRIEHPIPTDQLTLRHDQRIEDPTFRRAVELLDQGDAKSLHSHLQAHSAIVHQHVTFEGSNYFHSPTLLEFIAENPVRHGHLPPNIVEVARIILEAGPTLASRNETLALVATGSVPRECHLQRPLIDLLCRHGADPNTAIRGAALLDEHDSVLALLDQGATLDLPVAAALGRLEDCTRLLDATPQPDPAARHLALAVAAQFGHAAIVRLLLDAGEEPNRYNPSGGHSHATPLHQAAGAGHQEVVRLLVERGALLDQKDILWHATPADWATHEGKSETAQYLRTLTNP